MTVGPHDFTTAVESWEFIREVRFYGQGAVADKVQA